MGAGRPRRPSARSGPARSASLIPAFPEYVGFAESEREARQLIREGIEFELERLHDEGKVAPSEAPVPMVLRVAA